MNTNSPAASSRIAPAGFAIALNNLSASYTDVDGDFVTIKFSQPIASNAVYDLVGQGSLADGSQLRGLDLAALTEVGLSVTITAKPQNATADNVPDGDGLVNIGYLNANGLALGAVSIAGDLGKIVAGTGAGMAVKSLSVRSLGEDGLATGAPNLQSLLSGGFGSLKVAGNIRGATFHVVGDLGSAAIGGSLIGGAVGDSGEIFADGNLGPVTVRGDVIGGDGSYSGSIGDGNDAVVAGGTISRIASITIKGQVLGDPGTIQHFGFFAQTIGSFKSNGVSVALHRGASNDKFAGGAIGDAHPVGPTIGGGTPDAFAVHVFEV